MTPCLIVFGSVFVFTTLLIAIPSAIKVFNYIATLWRGNLQLTPAMLFSIGLVSTFITGGLTGLILGDSALDINVHDTYFVLISNSGMKEESIIFDDQYNEWRDMDGYPIDEIVIMHRNHEGYAKLNSLTLGTYVTITFNSGERLNGYITKQEQDMI